VVVRDGGCNFAEDVSDAVFTIDTEIGIDEPIIPTITKSRLYQNYPNPFNTETTITFSITENTGNTELSIYNIRGQKIMTLINKELSAGKHSIIWKGNDKNNKRVPIGIYYYKIKTGKFSETKKMILMK
ncbi:MAG: T9SS type A sorting domain-containing protein, partial [Bacteroidales bacterium]|nr:T9SS type A sorting domain-containing protein [Bacteroidales bacterium]